MQSPETNSSLDDAKYESETLEDKQKEEYRLLFIDDDQTILDGYKFIFESEGFVVDTAGDPETALKLVSENRYVIIVIDYILPGMKGDELAEKLHQIDEAAELIIISGQISAEEELQVRGVTVKEIFMKPLKMETLVDYVWEFVSFPDN